MKTLTADGGDPETEERREAELDQRWRNSGVSLAEAQTGLPEKALNTQGPGEPVLHKVIHFFFLIIIQLHVQLIIQATAAIAAEVTHRAAGEEYDAFELLVVEEVVEGPEAALLSKRVRVQVWVVAVDVTALQVDLLVDGVPQFGPQRVKLLPHSREQAAVHCIGHPVEAGLAAELVGAGGAEVVIGSERLVQGGDEVEQSLPAALITQRILTLVPALTQQVGAWGAAGLWG